MIAMGIIDLRKMGDHYLKLRNIHERVLSIIESYLPDELAIEAPFFGKNVQSMLKLGRAQGVVMAAALSRDIPITEYAPLKIKMAITSISVGKPTTLSWNILTSSSFNFVPCSRCQRCKTPEFSTSN